MLQVGYGSHGSLVVNMQVLDEEVEFFAQAGTLRGASCFCKKLQSLCYWLASYPGVNILQDAWCYTNRR